MFNKYFPSVSLEIVQKSIHLKVFKADFELNVIIVKFNRENYMELWSSLVIFL